MKLGINRFNWLIINIQIDLSKGLFFEWQDVEKDISKVCEDDSK